MPASAARIAANRANCLKSTGPKTVEGKDASRRNGLKHGMAGAGIVLPDAESAEVERRHSALLAEMAPRSAMGSILVHQLATLSVRMEQGARQERAATAERVRHAAATLDQDRVEAAEALLAAIGDDPRAALRRLRRTPEGVDRLVEAWGKLRADLAREPKPDWDGTRIVRMAHLLGHRDAEARGSRLEALGRATWGFFAGLTPADGAGLADEARKGWARDVLLARIDEALAELEAHDATLDHEAFALDRAEAGERALFDASKGASLARRYEAEARRGFFRSLAEFGRVEAEAVEINPVAPVEVVTPAGPPPAALASSREPVAEPLPAALELAPPPLWPPSATFRHPEPAARTADSVPFSIGKAAARGPASASGPGRSAGQ